MYFNMMSNLKNKKGQGMVEYVLIIGLIAILVIGALSPLGGAIATKFKTLTTEVTKAGVPTTP
jgi:pilus assembly protein Flp/PilA